MLWSLKLQNSNARRNRCRALSNLRKPEHQRLRLLAKEKQTISTRKFRREWVFSFLLLQQMLIFSSRQKSINWRLNWGHWATMMKSSENSRSWKCVCLRTYIISQLILSQFVEFSGFDANDEEETDVPNGYDSRLYLPSPNAEKTNIREGRSLETLLATKNKRLQEELTKLRVRHSRPAFQFPYWPVYRFSVESSKNICSPLKQNSIKPLWNCRNKRSWTRSWKLIYCQ